jgi:hypothetical protein
MYLIFTDVESMHMDGYCNFFLIVFTINKMSSCQITIPSINSKVPNTSNKLFASLISLSKASLIIFT